VVVKGIGSFRCVNAARKDLKRKVTASHGSPVRNSVTAKRDGEAVLREETFNSNAKLSMYIVSVA
jgi:hypothetical protein